MARLDQGERDLKEEEEGREEGRRREIDEEEEDDLDRKSEPQLKREEGEESEESSFSERFLEETIDIPEDDEDEEEEDYDGEEGGGGGEEEERERRGRRHAQEEEEGQREERGEKEDREDDVRHSFHRFRKVFYQRSPRGEDKEAKEEKEKRRRSRSGLLSAKTRCGSSSSSSPTPLPSCSLSRSPSPSSFRCASSPFSKSFSQRGLSASAAKEEKRNKEEEENRKKKKKIQEARLSHEDERERDRRLQRREDRRRLRGGGGREEEEESCILVKEEEDLASTHIILPSTDLLSSFSYSSPLLSSSSSYPPPCQPHENLQRLPRRSLSSSSSCSLSSSLEGDRSHPLPSSSSWYSSCRLPACLFPSSFPRQYLHYFSPSRLLLSIPSLSSSSSSSSFSFRSLLLFISHLCYYLLLYPCVFLLLLPYNVLLFLLQGGKLCADLLLPPPLPKRSFSWRKFCAFLGPGWIVAMAFLDPGNLEGDLQAGSRRRPPPTYKQIHTSFSSSSSLSSSSLSSASVDETGYGLLWVILWGHVGGWIFQLLAARLGNVTGKDLATLCRCQYTRGRSIALWIFMELAIIGADVQAVIGCAVALDLLLGIPVWIGVLVTLADSFIFLSLNASRTRQLENFFSYLIAIMFLSFLYTLLLSKPVFSCIMRGLFIPSFPDTKQKAFDLISLVGCILMPHNIFLHSALALTRKVKRQDIHKVAEANYYFALEAGLTLAVSFLLNSSVLATFASPLMKRAGAARVGESEGLAAPFLIPAGASAPSMFIREGEQARDVIEVGREGGGRGGGEEELTLATAPEALEIALGHGAKFVWATGLLAAGQNATLAGTYAGQFVMQGFLNFRLSRSLRLIITRLVTILPLTILSSLNDDVVDSICRYVNIAQAFLLPFALIPLLLFSFSSRIMGVFIITGWRKWGVCTLAACVTLGNYAIAIYQIYTSQLLTTSSSSSTFFFFFFSSSYRHVYYLGLAVLLFAYACLLIGMMRQKIRGVFCLYLLASHTYSSSSSASPRLDSIENEAFQSTSTFCGEEHRRHEEKRRRMACAKERREDLLMKGKDIEKEVLQGGGEEEEEGGSGGEEEIRRMSMKGGGC